MTAARSLRAAGLVSADRIIGGWSPDSSPSE